MVYIEERNIKVKSCQVSTTQSANINLVPQIENGKISAYICNSALLMVLREEIKLKDDIKLGFTSGKARIVGMRRASLARALT